MHKDKAVMAEVVEKRRVSGTECVVFKQLTSLL